MYFNFYEVCVFVGLIAFVVVCAFLTRFLMQAFKTAKAVEQLAKDADANLLKTNGVFELVESMSTILNSTWFKLLGAGFAIAKAKRKKEHEKEQELEEEIELED